MLSSAYKKIILPFLQASGLSSEDQKKIKEVLSQVIVGELVIKIIASLPADKVKDVSEQLEKAETKEKKIEILNKTVAEHSEAQTAATIYLTEGVPTLLEEVVGAFLKNTTPEQKQKFLDLTAGLSPE